MGRIGMCWYPLTLGWRADPHREDSLSLVLGFYGCLRLTPSFPVRNLAGRAGRQVCRGETDPWAWLRGRRSYVRACDSCAAHYSAHYTTPKIL
ncbi:hypothetical protein RRG08_031306 [Elysia crispata]|uniref:Uncharacterized protein n=1 Tax=Elysia crispata TaxID=231223 RepID=A0AAE0YIM5_9GAST|nr:hypothetical protein RRG08_031306 [Elysia crispata]